MYAVLTAVFTAARRHPITFFLIVWNPVILTIILSVVMPLVGVFVCVCVCVCVLIYKYYIY